MANKDLLSLLLAKARALFHDPPNKAWVLREHEEIARRVREFVLGRASPFSSGLERRWEEAIRRADVMASSFDRWLLNTLYAQPSGPSRFFDYYGLHNIFDPRYRVLLPKWNSSLETSMEETLRELGEALSKIAEKAYSEGGELRAASLGYAFLYTALEILWLSRGLPVGPADTRMPTHTVFDHLYAVVSVLNIAVEEEPSGYLVSIDVPGIQAFVGSARKAGDFWAGSWILSRVVWGTAARFMDSYGPDVLLTPSPRLNPYMVYRLTQALKDLGLGDIASMICDRYKSLLGSLGIRNLIGWNSVEGEGCGYLEGLYMIPLIPATAKVVLPKMVSTSVDELKSRVYKDYLSSWEEIVRDVEEKLRSAINSASQSLKLSTKILSYIYSRVKDVINRPPTTPSITVVDLREAYRDLLNCLTGNSEACESLGIDPKISVKVRGKEEAYAKKLLWHIAISRGHSIGASRSAPPLPSPYWSAEGDRLRPVISHATYEDFAKRWRPCSLDGTDPAVVYLGKKIFGRDEDFDRDMLKRILGEVLGSVPSDSETEAAARSLRLFLRPGEALCPYCFLKRITYVAYSQNLKKVFGLSSTDDVALGILDGEIYRGLVERGVREMFEEERFVRALAWILPIALETGYTHRMSYGERFLGRDIMEAARSMGNTGLDLEGLRREFREGIAKNIIKRIGKDPKEILELASSMFKYYDGVIDLEKLINIERAEKLVPILELRTSYAIVKGDADGMGEIIGGDLESMGVEGAKHYAERLLEDLREVLGSNADPEILKTLEKAFISASEIAELVEGKSWLVVSPAYSIALSTSLMVSALRQADEVLSLKGFPVYVGGDDLLALLPIESALAAVMRLRKIFWGGGEMFHVMRRGDGTAIPVAPAIPTGQSFSVRFAQLMDIMAHEISRTSETLEEYAKKAAWRLGLSGIVSKKDSLVMSDSRSGEISIAPLSLPEPGGKGKRLVCGEVIGAIVTMWAASILGSLSSNLPENYDEETFQILTRERAKIFGEPLKKLFEKVLRRNITRKEAEAKRVLEEISARLSRIYGDGVFSLECLGDTMASHIVNSYRILRGYP